MKTKWLIGLNLLFRAAASGNTDQIDYAAKRHESGRTDLGAGYARCIYKCLARTNGPEGHWMTFTGYIGGSTKPFQPSAI